MARLERFELTRAEAMSETRHGLRPKSGEARLETRAAENGATVNQLMALYGWKTEKMALLYTRKADRKRLALTAAPLLLPPAQTPNENRPHLGSGAGAEENLRKRSGA
jgi:hypothetical protein